MDTSLPGRVSFFCFVWFFRSNRSRVLLHCGLRSGLLTLGSVGDLSPSHLILANRDLPRGTRALRAGLAEGKTKHNSVFYSSGVWCKRKLTLRFDRDIVLLEMFTFFPSSCRLWNSLLLYSTLWLTWEDFRDARYILVAINTMRNDNETFFVSELVINNWDSF